MTAVDDAIERAELYWAALDPDRARTDVRILAAEVKRLREEQPFIWGLGFSACQRGDDATQNPYDPRRQP